VVQPPGKLTQERPSGSVGPLSRTVSDMMSPVFSPTLLENKVALITGGGTGICRGIALAFAAHGCHVAITSRKLEHLEPTRDEIQARGVRAMARAADVRDPAAVAELIAAVASELGRVRISS